MFTLVLCTALVGQQLTCNPMLYKVTIEPLTGLECSAMMDAATKQNPLQTVYCELRKD